MNRRRADLVVGGLVAAVLVVGGALTWQAYRQQQALGGMMESMMGSDVGVVHGPNPLWYLLGTLLVAAAVGGVYVAVRDSLPTTAASPRSPDAPSASESASPATGTAAADARAGVDESDATLQHDATDSTTPSRARVLDLLPEDERRVLEPVLASPGITQIELRDRSDFSKSKVSQTVSGLEKRGLLYRERQGRTYRVYPSDDLRRDQE